jgi:tetratricopeptide (TPR) repeat protein
MFMGGVIWESGLAVPAVLAEYCSRHRRIPGLPQMPQQVAELLAQCLVFDPSKRLSNCHSLARTLSEIHSELFGEPIVFAEHGTPELAADSLNNRAVSLLEVGRESEAGAMLDRLVSSRPDHVEGNFNQLLLIAGRGQITWSQMKVRLAPLVANQPDDSLAEHQKMAETALRERMKQPQRSGSLRNLPFVLARPKSGAEHQYEDERFNRLISKAAAAFESGNANEARRYLRMAMDIEGFSSHPKLRALAATLA